MTRDDSETIGFVIACLFSNAISVEELRTWCTDVVIANCEIIEIPSYVFDLMDFNGPIASVYKVVGFAPIWQRTEDEDDSLFGIAIERGRYPIDSAVDQNLALLHLSQNPSIRRRFRDTFPFLG